MLGKMPKATKKQDDENLAENFVLNLGIKNKNHLVIHSSLFYLLAYGIRTDELYKSLKKQLGANSKIAVPTFNILDRTKWFSDSCAFDKSNGILSKYLFENTLGFRSSSAMHSYFLSGSDEHYKLPFDNPDKSFGTGSIFEYFIAKDYCFLLLGCDLTQGASIIHHIECEFEVPYRKEVTITRPNFVNTDCEKLTNYKYYARISEEIKTDLSILQAEGIENGVIRKITYGKIHSYVFNAQSFCDFVFRKLEKNPYYLVRADKR